MKRMLRVLAGILVFCMMVNALPMEVMGGMIREASAQAEAERAVTVSDFDGLLAPAEEIREQGKEGSDGVWRYAAFGGYAVITGHDDMAVSEADVPDQVNGLDVVGIANDAFAGHTGLNRVGIPGNVFAMGKRALPRGTTVSAMNGSYAQRWARQNGYAFENASRYEFREGVIDFTGIRQENFIRVSAEEIRLRELEAKRLAVGKRFFLIDESNAYQISYYEAEEIGEAKNGFVTIRCRTPEIGDVIVNLSQTEEYMMPDLSTLKLEEGVEYAGEAKREWGDWSREHEFSLPLKIKIAGDDIGNYGKWYVNGGAEFSWKLSFDFHWAEMQKAKLTQAFSANITGGIGVSRDFATDDVKKEKNLTKACLKRYQKAAKETKKGRNYRTVTKPKLGSVVVFSYAGAVSLLVDIHLQFELSGKVEVSFSYTNQTIYDYAKDKGWSKRTNNRGIDAGLTIEAELKVGLCVELALYIAVFKAATLEVFAGFDCKATWDLQNATSVGEDSFLNLLQNMRQNCNMLDAIVIDVAFVVDVGVTVGKGKFSLGAMVNLITIPLFTYHFHLCSMVYQYNEQTQTWEDTKEPKNMWHEASECPYDTKNVEYRVQRSQIEKHLYLKDKVGYLFANKETLLKRTDNLMIGETVAGATTAEEKLKNSGWLKLLSWHSDASLSDTSIVTFPVTVGKEDLTFYAKVVPYHKIQLINSEGKILNDDADLQDGRSLKLDAEVNTGDETTHLSQTGNKAAEGEKLKLPQENDLQQEIEEWHRVVGPKNQQDIGDPMAGGDEWPIPKATEETIYLMALTEYDVKATFFVDNNEIYTVYCAKGGKIQAPTIPPRSGQRLKQWVLKKTGETLDPCSSFDTTGRENHLFFDVVFETDPDYLNPYSNAQMCGNTNGFSTGHDSGSSIDDILVFDSTDRGTITGVKSGANPARLSIPYKRPDGTRITAIAANAFANNQSLVSIILPSSIQSIGAHAFDGCPKLEYIIAEDIFSSVAEEQIIIPSFFAYNCPKLKGVTLPKTLKSISSYAFAYCPELDSVKLDCAIGSYAFSGDTKIASVELGTGCTAINGYAFNGCTALTSIELPNTVATLGERFLYGCTGLTTVTINGTFTELGTNTLVIGSGSSLATVILGDNIQTIGEKALANGDYGFPLLKQITIPGTVTSIGKNAFAGAGIEELTLSLPYQNGSAVTEYAFSNMPSLWKVTILSGKIGNYAFSGNTKLKDVVIGSHVSTIGYGAFQGCNRLENVTIEEGVTSISGYAFGNCMALTGLEIPNSVTSLGNAILGGSMNLTYLKVGGGIEVLENTSTTGTTNTGSSYTTYSQPFYIGQGSKLKTLVLGEGIRELGERVFTNYVSNSNQYGTYYFPQLTYVELPSTLETIGKQAFLGSNIQELVLTDGLASTSSVFEGMTSLKKLTVKSGRIGSYAFSGCTNLESVTLEDGVTEIYGSAFQNCKALTSLVIPDSVTYLGSGFLSGCTNLTYLKVGGGVPVLKNIQTYGTFPSGLQYSSYSQPFYIGDGSKLTTLVLGEGITELGDGVFTNYYCNSNSSDTYYFPQLTTVELPSSLETIGKQAFLGANIRELVLADGLASTNSVFEGMTSLKKVTVKGGIIGGSAFNCKALTSLTIPDSVTLLGSGFLSGCTNLTYLKVGGGIPVLKNSTYTGTYSTGGTYTSYSQPFYIGSGSKLTTLVLGEGIKELGEGVFTNYYSNGNSYGTYYFPQLTTVELPSTLETIGKQAFLGANISELVLADGLASTNSVFEGMTSLKRVTVKGGEIGSSAFSGCTNLESVTLEEGVTAIYTRAEEQHIYRHILNRRDIYKLFTAFLYRRRSQTDDIGAG